MAQPDIHIDRNPQNISPLIGDRRVVVLCDRFFRDNDLPVPFRGAPIIWIEASEEAKTLTTVERVIRELLELKVDRDCLLLGIGGGVTTDITGFVASIYKRGLPFGLVPTTLLAMVDASIGGKNAVNFEGYKNIAGCFREPEFIFICPEFTQSLPEREFRCGLAEMLKTFIIADSEYYNLAVEDCRGNLFKLLIRCVEIKSGIVSRDPFDVGERRLLNLGHTFAHAIEKSTNLYKHGEAVSIGIVMAARMAVEEGLADSALVDRLCNDFLSLSLPVEASGVDAKVLETAMLQDKKRKDGGMVFVLPVGIGKVTIWEKSATVFQKLQ